MISSAGPHLIIYISLSRYEDSHVKDKTVVRLSHLYNGNLKSLLKITDSQIIFI